MARNYDAGILWDILSRVFGLPSGVRSFVLEMHHDKPPVVRIERFLADEELREARDRLESLGVSPLELKVVEKPTETGD